MGAIHFSETSHNKRRNIVSKQRKTVRYVIRKSDYVFYRKCNSSRGRTPKFLLGRSMGCITITGGRFRATEKPETSPDTQTAR